MAAAARSALLEIEAPSTAENIDTASATSLPAGKENTHAVLGLLPAASSPQPPEYCGRSPVAPAQVAKTPGSAFLLAASPTGLHTPQVSICHQDLAGHSVPHQS